MLDDTISFRISNFHWAHLRSFCCLPANENVNSTPIKIKKKESQSQRTHTGISLSSVTYCATAFPMTQSADHKLPHVQAQTETPFLAAAHVSVGSWGGVRRDSRDLLISHREVSQGAETESSYKTRMGWKNGGSGRLEPSSPGLDVFLTLIHYHNSVSMFDAHGFRDGGALQFVGLSLTWGLGVSIANI